MRPRNHEKKLANFSRQTSPQSPHDFEGYRLESNDIKKGIRPKARSKKTYSKADALLSVLEKATGKSLLICLKGYPDPDNIACSLALEWLAQTHDIKTKIVYFDDISHYENRALVKKLDLDLEQVSKDKAMFSSQSITPND